MADIRECFWIDNKTCPYLQNVNIIQDGSNYVMGVDKIDTAMLEHFSISEICSNCLMATYIKVRSRV